MPSPTDSATTVTDASAQATREQEQQTPEQENAAWRTWRREFVTSPLGNLALVLTDWGQPGAEPVDEQTARAGHPADAAFTRLTRRDIDTGETQHGYRIWQQDSPANQAFERIEYYDYDADWVIEAEFEYVDDGRVVPFEHIRDNGASRDLPVSGDIVFTRDGVDYRLSAFDTAEGKLQLVFGDPTNGDETYPAGRFLYVHLPVRDGIRAGDRVPVTLDFNKAFVPPCGFSIWMNCPLPPAQNRFAVPVRAGEKRVVFADGFTL